MRCNMPRYQLIGRSALAIAIVCVSVPPLEAQAEEKKEKSEPTSQDCLQCHGEKVSERVRAVRPAELAAGPHSEQNGVSCVSCHSRAAQVPDISEHGKLGAPTCDGCHEAGKTVAASAHGHARNGGRLPGCADCHGAHELRRVADPASRTSPLRQLETCGNCHKGEVLRNYRQSVHGRRLERGQPGGPTCSTCHGGHAIAVADVRRNGPLKQAMTEACGKCHTKVFAEYRGGVHGQGLLVRGNYDSAACVDCHKSHQILPHTDPASAVYPTHVVRDCAGCHADARLIRRSALPSQVVRSYELSYHGRASELGSTAVANCASCHEHHGIYRSTDSRSSVHPDNLQRSCGKCHPGATRRFIGGKIHVSDERERNLAAWVVKRIYIGLILLIIGGMLLHNLMDFVRKMIVRARRQRSEPHVIRMTRQERVAHLLMLTTFLSLVYTGFALMFPHAWWVAPLNLISDTEQFRRWVHRGAGLVLTALTVHHLWFLLTTRRGREQRRYFMPRWIDARQLVENLLFYLGRRPQRPAFGRFSYMEKAEYWALVWGTAVMVVTGFVLWFQTLALAFMPRWLWEVFLVVHRYEAILAALAILVWHFYFVMVNPDEAPLSLTWITGRVTLHELSVQHAGELTELAATGELAPGSSSAVEGESQAQAEAHAQAHRQVQ